MPTNTADQGIQLPVDADTADAPVAFAANTSGIESRLVKRYASVADRTARNPSPNTGEFCYLTAEARWDKCQTGGGSPVWWEMFTFYARKLNETQVVNNSTVLVNDSHLLLAMQTNAVYALDGLLVWDSGTTGDIKFGWTVPAAATVDWWHVASVDVAVTTGIGNYVANLSNAAGTTLARAGSGIGTFVHGRLSGLVRTVGTAGNLQLQWAQNAGEVVNTRIKAQSWISLERIG